MAELLPMLVHQRNKKEDPRKPKKKKWTMNPYARANDGQRRIQLPPVEIWRHNIVPYLNTGDRHTMRRTGQRIAENTPQTPCTPWECVRIPLCLNKCDTFWVKASQLLTDFLWTLHSFADTHKSMVVQFEMMHLELLLWWTPGLGLFVHRDDVPKPPPGICNELWDTTSG